MQLMNFFILTFVVFISDVVLAEGESTVRLGKTPSVLYGFDLDLMYLGEFKGFASSRSAFGPALFADESGVSRRETTTFGLRKAAFYLNWSLPRGSRLEVTLRPDAVNRQTDGGYLTELDNRSGRTVEDLPSIHLLDEYRLRIRRDSVDAYVGVKHHVLEDFSVNPNVLGFGLRVLGPMKTFAAGLSFPGILKIGYGDDNPTDGLGFGFDVISGRDDRHDGRAGAVDEVGESPGKVEPYWGAAGHLSTQFSDQFRMGLTASGIEERANGGKRRLEWYQAGVRRSLVLGPVSKFLFAMEARQMRESNDNPLTVISDVNLTSVGVTSALHLADDQSAHFGFWLATGEVHLDGVLSSSRPTKAIQVDVAWKWLMEDQFEVVTALSREWRRDGDEGGGSTGGFRSDGVSRSIQSRFALQLNYRFGGQI